MLTHISAAAAAILSASNTQYNEASLSELQ
jgi:hypothetical protein